MPVRYRSHGTGSEYRNLLNYGFRKLGKDVVIEESVKIFHPQMLEIGDDCYIGHNSILKGYPYAGAISIRIGNGCWLGENVYLHGAGGIEIGDRVGIGPNVKMLTSYHDFEVGGKDRIMDNPLAFKGITIQEGADIQAGAFICAGVRIGKYASVSACAVVTKEVREGAIVRGVPAKETRLRKPIFDLYKS